MTLAIITELQTKDKYLNKGQNMKSVSLNNKEDLAGNDILFLCQGATKEELESCAKKR